MENDSGLRHMDDRDMACVILPDLDYEAQLVAIADLLRRHKKEDEQTAAQIKEVEDFARRTSGLRNEHAVDEWIDLLHGSTYQEAAHSMAAIGMIAPLIESLFYQAFQGIRAVYYGVDVIAPGSARSATEDTISSGIVTKSTIPNKRSPRETWSWASSTWLAPLV
jgi:hypothetical protein